MRRRLLILSDVLVAVFLVVIALLAFSGPTVGCSDCLPPDRQTEIFGTMFQNMAETRTVTARETSTP